LPPTGTSEYHLMGL